jgi:iron(III) transport system permease protein
MSADTVRLGSIDHPTTRAGGAFDWEEMVRRGALLVAVAFLLIAVALPLGTLLVRSFLDGSGQFVGLKNYITYVSTPTLVSSLWNSFWIAVASTLIVVPIAFGYAFALRRTCMRLKGLMTAVALLPLFAPSLLPAISFVYIFGTQGILKSWLMGAEVYGPIGILLSQVFYCLPHAMLILTTALALADARLYEAAETLGASRWRIFWTVTIPGIKYGLVSAIFVVFTLVITDFGIAKVIGGNFNVLATDAYKQVIGQQNFEMGAVVGLVLLVPAVIAFTIDRYIQRRQVALLTARAVPLEPKPRPIADAIALAFCLIIGGLVLFVLAIAVTASLITYWPYNLTPTLKWYNFTEYEPTGFRPYWNSLNMGAIAATLGTAIIFATAYLIEKGKGGPLLRSLAQLIAMLPMAVPGLVLGLSYVFFFNNAWNPLVVLYGGVFLLAMNSIAHFYTTAHITATTALKQIDGEFESVSASLKVPFWRTFVRVTVPISLPAILDIWIYMFVNALTTVSAVIFIYGPTSKLASITMVHMEDGGATAAAAALAVLIVVTALAAKGLHVVLDGLVLSRLQRWRRR